MSIRRSVDIDPNILEKYHEADPGVVETHPEVFDYGQGEIVSLRDVDRPNVVKESAQELSYTKWLRPGQLVGQVVAVIVFLVVMCAFVIGIDALSGVSLVPFMSGAWF